MRGSAASAVSVRRRSPAQARRLGSGQRRSAQPVAGGDLLLRRRLGGGRSRRLWLRRTRLRGARLRHRRSPDYRLVPDGAVSNLRRGSARAPSAGCAIMSALYRRRPAADQPFGSFGRASTSPPCWRSTGTYLADAAGRSGDRRAPAALLSGPYDFYPFTEQRGRDALGAMAASAGNPADQLRPARCSADAADARHRRYGRAAAQFANGWRRRSRPSARPPSSSSIAGKSHIDTIKSLSPLFRGTTSALADSVAFFNAHDALAASGLKREVRQAKLGGCCSTAEPSPPAPPRCCPAARRSAARAASPAARRWRRSIVDESRVIRTVAGLRPYRRSGFVVRAEPLGDKRAGPQLRPRRRRDHAELGHARSSRPSSGCQGHSGPVAVIGSGVMGLSTARLVQEAGFPVTIYAAALPPDTTSNIAGGQFHPFGRVPTRTRSRPSSWPSSPARSTIAGAASRSWSATITASAGCRPMSRRDSPEAQAARDLPADQPHADAGRASVPVERARSATTRCTSRPAAISAR